MSELHRVFFALPLPEAAIPVLEAAASRALPEAASLEPRMQRGSQLHVTLKFVGSVDATVFSKLVQLTASEARRFEAFDASLAHVTAFPSPRRARVLVALVASESKVLPELASSLDEACGELGVARESRAFRAHVTLARLRRPGDATRAMAATELEPLGVRMSELVLFESTLGPGGARYERRAAARLG